MKILHTADIHLNENEVRWNALEAVLALGAEENVDIMAISGDLFDAEADALKLRTRLRESFAPHKFAVYIIPGNHDAKAFDGAFLGSNLKIINSVTDIYETGDVRITGIPFQNIREKDIYRILKSLSDKLDTKKRNILLFHGELLDSYYSRNDFGHEQDERYMPVRLDFFRDTNFDYVLAGHFHTNFSAWEYAKQKYFVYPGSPVPVTTRETGKRKVNIFNAGPGGAPREIVLDVPYYHEVKVTLDPLDGTQPVDAVKKALLSAQSKALVYLTVSGYLKSGTSEQDLYKQLQDIKEQNANISDIVFEAIDISRILDDDIFRSFSERLNAGNYTDAKKQSMTEYFIRSMIESL